ncbi:hypothetical protein Plhal304r1_c035g0108011 [Plasmopara halstedii]
MGWDIFRYYGQCKDENAITEERRSYVLKIGRWVTRKSLVRAESKNVAWDHYNVRNCFREWSRIQITKNMF